MKRLIVLIILATGCEGQSPKLERLELTADVRSGYILCFSGSTRNSPDTLHIETCRDYFRKKHKEYGDSLSVDIDWSFEARAMGEEMHKTHADSIPANFDWQPQANRIKDVQPLIGILLDEKIHTEFARMKPPEAVRVTTSTSVPSAASPEKSIIINITAGDKVYLLFGDSSNQEAILADVNKTMGLNLSEGELADWGKTPVVGIPFAQVKTILNMTNQPSTSQLPGIPVKGSNNQLADWIASINHVYASNGNKKPSLLVKGDNNPQSSVFSNVLEALKKNDIQKFKLVTSSDEPNN